MPFDLNAYLRRLGLPEIPTNSDGTLDLAALHRAHVGAIVFENLDPRRGVRVELTPEALQDKLVRNGRGGYCFEQNLLFKLALDALPGDATVEPLLARVRWNRPPDAPKPRTHLCLRVGAADGSVWHADVGFGNGTLLEPIPLGPGGPYTQSGWRFRVIEERDPYDGDQLVLQTERDGEWADVYAFSRRPALPIDIETSNWYASTHPDSAFARGLIVARNHPDGARTVLSDLRGELWLRHATPAAATEAAVAPDELAGVLGERFGLPNPGTLLG